VPATGLKGYINKSDVLKHIKSNNLVLRTQEAAVPKAEQPKKDVSKAVELPPKKAEPPQKPAAKTQTKQPSGAASPVFNPNDPF